jgi:hypothetical protein
VQIDFSERCVNHEPRQRKMCSQITQIFTDEKICVYPWHL